MIVWIIQLEKIMEKTAWCQKRTKRMHLEIFLWTPQIIFWGLVVHLRFIKEWLWLYNGWYSQTTKCLNSEEDISNSHLQNLKEITTLSILRHLYPRRAATCSWLPLTPPNRKTTTTALMWWHNLFQLMGGEPETYAFVASWENLMQLADTYACQVLHFNSTLSKCNDVKMNMFSL